MKEKFQETIAQIDKEFITLKDKSNDLLFDIVNSTENKAASVSFRISDPEKQFASILVTEIYINNGQLVIKAEEYKETFSIDDITFSEILYLCRAVAEKL